MAFIPIAIQLLPLIPSLVENVIKIVEAIRHDPVTDVEIKASLEAVSARLTEVKAQVAAVRLPA